jgi:chorismate mutase
MVAVRGIRGATTVEVDSAVEIVEATREMLEALIEANGIEPADVAAAWFTTTVDLRTEFPAVAARRLGWVDVPLICGHEMDVPAANPRSIPRCIRTLILLNTDRAQGDITHIYLRGARAIREELDRARAGDLPVPAPLGPMEARGNAVAAHSSAEMAWGRHPTGRVSAQTREVAQ